MDTVVTDDVLFILAKSEQYFCQILHLISCTEMRQKPKYVIDISQDPLQVRKKKKTLGKKELYLTARKPWDNYISL